MTGSDATAVALLHDVLEDTELTGEELRTGGIGEEVVAAVELLTKPAAGSYDEYIDRIATTAGPAGELARAVKRADLEDNLARSRNSGDQERVEKYQRALRFLGGSRNDF